MLDYKQAKTMGCINMPIITITDFNDKTIPIGERYCVIVTARSIPGESNSSWVMHVSFTIYLSKGLNRKDTFPVIPIPAQVFGL